MLCFCNQSFTPLLLQGFASSFQLQALSGGICLLWNPQSTKKQKRDTVPLCATPYYRIQKQNVLWLVFLLVLKTFLQSRLFTT